MKFPYPVESFENVTLLVRAVEAGKGYACQCANVYAPRSPYYGGRRPRPRRCARLLAGVDRALPSVFIIYPAHAP